MKKLISKALLAVIFTVGLVACAPNQPAKFAKGQKVKAIISGQVGMVVYSRDGYTDGRHYTVRFAANQTTTNTKLLSQDKPMTSMPLAIVRHLREFELEAASH